jgi:hypothetical protein
MTQGLWRTLIRVERFDQTSVYVVIPGWDHEKVIRLRNDLFPLEILRTIESGQPYLHARIPLAVDDESLLTFQDWEHE